MNHQTIKKIAVTAWAMLLLILMVAQTAGAVVQATLDQDTVYAGEPFTLTLSIEGVEQGSEPDFSPLEQGFRILGSSTSQQIRIINGRRSDKTLWLVQLEPKRLGRIEIPALEIGGQQTRPLTVTVQEVPETSADQGGLPLFLEIEVKPEGGGTYVQQQIRYRVRLLLASNLLSGNLSEPSPADAVVERLGDERRYRVERGGRAYQVIERNYAIFPEKSGELQIPPVRFSGRVQDPHSDRGRARGRSGSLMERFFGGDPLANDPFFQNMPSFGSGFFSSGGGRPVTLRSKVSGLTIKPRPVGYSGRYWLPAAGLELRDSWAGEPPELRAGEPVTRTITIEAKGLEGSQIPRIELVAPPGVRIYPEPPVVENRTDGSWVFGQSRQSWTYVPSQAEGLEIAGVGLTWWDSTAGEERVARLPAWELKVRPGVGGSIPAVVTPSVVGNGTPGDSLQTRPELEEAPRPVWLSERWPWLVAAVVLLVLVPLLLWRRRSVVGSTQDGQERKTSAVLSVGPGRREALVHLKRACQGGAAAGAAKALLELGALRWPEDPPGSLGALATRLGQGGEQVRQLDRALYAREGTEWDGMALWRAFEQGIPEQARSPGSGRENPLDPLYPQRI